jgi:hypothetical protein
MFSGLISVTKLFIWDGYFGDCYYVIIIHHRLNFMNFCLFVFCYLACTLSMILSICILLFVLHSFNDFVYLYFVVCIALFQ